MRSLWLVENPWHPIGLELSLGPVDLTETSSKKKNAKLSNF